MVHLIVFEDGNPNATAQAVAYLQEMASGYIEVRPRVWVVGGDLQVQEWRDMLGGFGARVVVAKLSGAWATSPGFENVANWFRGAKRTF
jgi:hypothetical protein